ncbi:MAG: serine/threonine protein kinase [Candidatus Eisenbacteria bacterium]|uniref:Serine/threonine protein kinase n=1 Tax=Eiseniibacteriota bacterium TaxID=2212470 RepID=A0A956SFL1_UNCEI|nr:serine/threonine protein kinase [Candidatus Eisenbacteria bacterium]
MPGKRRLSRGSLTPATFFVRKPKGGKRYRIRGREVPNRRPDHCPLLSCGFAPSAPAAAARRMTNTKSDLQDLPSSRANTPEADLSLERQARSFFLQALELTTDERDRLLSDGAPPDVVSRTRELLRLHDEHVAALDRAMRLADALPPTVGDYRILSRLGRGGSSTVYLAERDDRRVALKLLHAELSRTDVGARFARETSVLSRLARPGLARLVDSGVVELDGEPVPYIAMDYVDGPTIRTVIEERELGDDEKLDLLGKLLAAISYAHEQGVVHRDLKPDNVKLTSTGDPVVLDFGISRLLDLEDSAGAFVTRTVELMGTLPYMSPEQLAGETVGPQSDLYSLGVVAYELLCGRLPFDLPESSVVGTILALSTSTPTPVDPALATRLPGIDAFLANAMARSVEHRYGSTDAMLMDLDRLRRGKPVRRLAPSSSSSAERSKRSRWIAAISAASVLLGFVGVFTWSSRDRIDPTVVDAVTNASRLAIQHLHLEPRTAEGASAAIQALEEARRQIPSTRGLAGILTWIVDLRLGEAYLIHGFLTEDASSFRKSAETYTLATELGITCDDLEGVPEGWAPMAEMKGVMHLPRTGVAGANAALASIQNTKPNLERAVSNASFAFRAITNAPEQTFCSRVSRSEREVVTLVGYNDHASYLTELADATNDPSPVERALGFYAELDTLSIKRDRDRSAYGSYLFYSALAYLVRYELEANPADLDSAQARNERAWSVSGAGGMRPYIESERARIVLARSRSCDPHLAVEQLSAEVDELDRVREALGDTPRIHAATTVFTILLELQHEVASRGRDGRELARAKPWIAEWNAVLPSEGFPIARGEFLLARARHHRLLAELGHATSEAVTTEAAVGSGLESEDQTRDPRNEHLQLAASDLREAHYLLPAIQRPSFDARVEKELGSVQSLIMTR